jgi:acyl-CoA synthetase (AMP-forming)/AMP-acid ligase II/aryl carrier-like protein
LSNIIERLGQRPAAEKRASRRFSSIAEIIRFYARTAPGRHALLGPGIAPLTYGALWTQAKDVIRGLRRLGIRRTDRVAVVLPDGPDAAVATVAIAAGAVCVPLNPRFTVGECQACLADLRLSTLLTEPAMDSAWPGVADRLGIAVINASRGSNQTLGAWKIARGSGAQPKRNGEFASSADDAFILMTSGSTSRPKTVPLTQAAVCLSASNVGVVLELGPADRLLSVLPLFHGHGLISGVLAALAAGSSVVCTPQFDPAAFFGWLSEYRPTWYTAVPSIHRAILAAADSHQASAMPCSLRLVRSASASLPPGLLHELETLFGVPVIDTFGMTEAATQIAANPLSRRKPGSVGKPAGAEIVILDGEGRRLLCGETGEIALRGPTITRGYDNDPAATQAAFRDGWFRTGDLGYLDQDGYLFIVGRIKDIINRGGQKVAPAEVEQVLLSHPDVIEALACAIPHKRLGEAVAAAVVLRADAQVSAQSLRSFARERLAEFKVPSLIRIVPEIPKGPAGKIKRDGLAAALSLTPPRARAETRDKGASPRSQLEQELAKLWAELLELKEIGIDEDVFELGADSITATQVLSRLRARHGVDLSFKDILDAPSAAMLAARIAGSQSHCANLWSSLDDRPTRILRKTGHGPQPLSLAQEQMLRFERALPGLPQFNRPLAYHLKGPLDVSALQRSVAEIVRRHGSLRTAFAWKDELPVALVAPPVEGAPSLVVENLVVPAVTSNAAKTLLLRKVELEAERQALAPIDTSRAPLLRARLFRIGPDDHVLLLILHDLIVDAWSMGILMEDVSKFYAAFAAGRPVPLPEATLDFSDFARWQRHWTSSEPANVQLAFWKKSLRDFAPLFPIGSDQQAALLDAQSAHDSVHLSNDLVARLSALAHSRGATLFMTLLAGFKTLLLARSGRGDICVGTSMANRPQLSMERVIGPVANTVIIRTRLDPDLSFQDALGRVRNSVIDAYSGQELPFEALAPRLSREEDGVEPASLVQVSFVLQNAFRRPLDLIDVSARPFACWNGQAVMSVDPTWLSLTLYEAESGMNGSCRCKTGLFQSDTGRYWMADYKTILTKAVANPETSLGRLADY